MHTKKSPPKKHRLHAEAVNRLPKKNSIIALKTGWLKNGIAILISRSVMPSTSYSGLT
jgi:hypothetical protein